MKKLRQTVTLLLVLALLLVLVPGAAAAETTGTVTIGNAEPDQEYALYRIFDLAYASSGGGRLNMTYTISEKWANFFGATNAGAGYLLDEMPDGAGSLNTIQVGGTTKYINITEENVAAFAGDALDWLGAQNATFQPDQTVKGVQSGGTVTAVAEDMPLGYYLVYPKGASEIISGNASICSLTSTLPDAMVAAKAEAPDITITAEPATAAIGDKITFQTTGKVPNTAGFEAYSYVVHFVLPPSMIYNRDITVKIGDKEISNYQWRFASLEDESQEHSIAFADFAGAPAGTPITVRLSATINQNAHIGSTPNTCTAWLEYSSDPQAEDARADTKTQSRKADVYMTAITIHKVDANSQETSLAGAKFKITGASLKALKVNGQIYQKTDYGPYYMLKDGTFTLNTPGTADSVLYDSTTQKYSAVDAVTKQNASENFLCEGYVNENGVLTFEGLGEGEYAITELVAPDGYNLLTSPIELKITLAGTVDEQTGVTAYEWKYEKKGASGVYSEVTSLDTQNGTLYFNVGNNAGSKLPETGGAGTAGFYIAGVLLMVAALVLADTKRKMTAKTRS